MNEPNLTVEYVPIDSIKPYKRNAKLHPQEQIEQIKASMREFGNIDPIGIWHNEIVDGHGRFIAARELGYSAIPVIRLDQLSDEQRKAYALVHNKLTMNTWFDIDALNIELSQITDIDMKHYGLETLETVARDVQDFFDNDEPKPEQQEKNRVQFTVKPGDEKPLVIAYLKEMGVEYDEN